jgi:hypothetical protein
MLHFHTKLRHPCEVFPAMGVGRLKLVEEEKLGKVDRKYSFLYI